VWRVLAKARQAREEARLHEAGTARLLDALRAAEGKPWAPEFQATLRESLEHSADQAKPSRKRRAAAQDDEQTEWAREKRNGEEEGAKHVDGERRGRAERVTRD